MSSLSYVPGSRSSLALTASSSASSSSSSSRRKRRPQSANPAHRRRLAAASLYSRKLRQPSSSFHAPAASSSSSSSSSSDDYKYASHALNPNSAVRRRGTATTLPDHPRALAGARLGPETTAAAKAAAGAANVAAGSSVSLIEKDARLCLSLQQEIRSVHRVLLQVPSPARRARRHGGAPAAAAATAAATPSHRATLDLYAGNGIAKAQSTAVRLENALREAMLEDVRTSSSTSASSGAIASKKLATLRKLLDRATRELVRRCLHPSVGCPTSTREPASRHRKRHDTTYVYIYM